MLEQSKTQRFFDLFIWLSNEGKLGISKDRILNEYHISPKTFSRDIKEMQKIFPFVEIRYDKDENRLFAKINLIKKEDNKTNRDEFGSQKKTTNQNLDQKISAIHDKKFSSAGSFVVKREHETKIMISDYELSFVFDAIIQNHILSMQHKGKTKNGFPLFICYYGERWYLFVYSYPEYKIFKYRLDLVQQVSQVNFRQDIKLPSSEEIEVLRENGKKKMKQSYNIFIDLNSQKDLNLTVRFFLSKKYIKQEFPKLESIIEIEEGVCDVKMSFSGYDEARFFLNKWIGFFEIRETEEFRKQYVDDLEEAIGII